MKINNELLHEFKNGNVAIKVPFDEPLLYDMKQILEFVPKYDTDNNSVLGKTKYYWLRINPTYIELVISNLSPTKKVYHISEFFIVEEQTLPPSIDYFEIITRLENEKSLLMDQVTSLVKINNEFTDSNIKLVSKNKELQTKLSETIENRNLIGKKLKDRIQLCNNVLYQRNELERQITLMDDNVSEFKYGTEGWGVDPDTDIWVNVTYLTKDLEVGHVVWSHKHGQYIVVSKFIDVHPEKLTYWRGGDDLDIEFEQSVNNASIVLLKKRYDYYEIQCHTDNDYSTFYATRLGIELLKRFRESTKYITTFSLQSFNLD